MLPTEGEIDQVTFGFDVPLNDALNCCVCPPDSETDVGDIVTETGTRDTTALAVLVESAALVAVTVTVWAEVMVAGAV